MQDHIELEGIVTFPEPFPAEDVEEAKVSLSLDKLVSLLTPPKKSWLERWGVTVVVASIGAAATLGVGLLSFIDDDPPDCLGYVETLLKVREEAATNSSAAEAVSAVDWGDLDDECGEARIIVELLGE